MKSKQQEFAFVLFFKVKQQAVIEGQRKFEQLVMIYTLCNSNSSDYTTFFLMHSRMNKKLTFDGYRPGRMAVMEHLRGKMQFCAAFPVCIFG